MQKMTLPSSKVHEVAPGQFQHMCPGCGKMHAFLVHESNFPITHKWNKNPMKPTVSPSIRHVWKEGINEKVCHYTINEGALEYTRDCHHALKGQKVPMPDMPKGLEETT